MFVLANIRFWWTLLLLVSNKYLAQATDDQEFYSVSTTHHPANNQEKICTTQIQNSLLLEVIKLQNNQILNLLESEITIHKNLLNTSENDLLKVREQLDSQVGEMGQQTTQLASYVESLLKNKKSDTCNKQHLEEAELHIVSAIENIVHQKVEKLNMKLQEAKQGIMSETERINQKIQKELTDVQKQVKEIEKKENNRKNEKCVNSQTKMLEDYNEKHKNLEKQINETKQSLLKLRNLPKDCKEIQSTGNNNSGIYYIQPEFGSDAFMVLCDMKTRGGGWIYVLNRFDGSQNFHLNWTEYKWGFGQLKGEFWLGLEYLHELTAYKTNELLIELVDWELKTVYAHYTSFGIGNKKENYALKTLKGYSGDATDSLSYHLNMNFSTPDHRNSTGGYCSTYFQAAWWYKECYTAHLTGVYLNQNSTENAKGTRGIHWNGFRSSNYSYSLKQVRMMIRPHQDSVILLPHEKKN